MKFLRKQLDKLAPNFEKGGKLEKWYPLYEAADSFMFTPGHRSKAGAHVRDSSSAAHALRAIGARCAGPPSVNRAWCISAHAERTRGGTYEPTRSGASAGSTCGH